MTSSNRLQVALVRETTPGVTPTTPRMRKVRITSESLTYTPEYVDSDEIRDDRMAGDPILVMKSSAGTVNFELSYPDDESPLSEIYRSAFMNQWQNTPQRFNDGTPDSQITGVTASTGVITVLTGAAFAVGHLIRNTGFGVAQNNGVFRVATGSATVPAVGAGLLVDEAVPPGTARTKVVGFAGVAGDLTASASGLASTALNFTTLGLAVGQWVKIGGTAVADRFATAANNGWARITAIAANALTLDNLPAGWTTDAGAGKTLKVWFGDQIKNGVTPSSLTIEKGFLGQQTPTYITSRGMQVGQLQHSITNRQKITGVATFTGMGGGQSTVSLDAAPDPVTTGQVMAAHANVGRVAEAGAALAGPNWLRSLEFTINNNLRTAEDVGTDSPAEVREGECTVTGRDETYFGDSTLLAKFYAGTPTSRNTRVQKNGQALIWQFPRVTYRSDGNPAAGGKNQDVMLPLGWQASKDDLTNAHVLLDRIEYCE